MDFSKERWVEAFKIFGIAIICIIGGFAVFAAAMFYVYFFTFFVTPMVGPAVSSIIGIIIPIFLLCFYVAGCR